MIRVYGVQRRVGDEPPTYQLVPGGQKYDTDVEDYLVGLCNEAHSETQARLLTDSTDEPTIYDYPAGGQTIEITDVGGISYEVVCPC